ncbi:MAG: class I SAM-dependent methyltransferase [Chloroflexota bacterium]|nr:class I SAM-dependent methyltransferase [Chloroflexota bacterium]MDE3192662.1 class I SAM-dependent methyltransferase [Chloroflexota bacterium]
MVVTRHPRAGREVRAFGGARLFRGKDVLDIGTGNGRLAFDVAPYARRVLGIDPSEDSVRVARERAAAEGLRNVEFRVGDAAALDVGRERYDIAIFSWSL